MSAGGLIANAFLGGAAQVGKGIGDRIRADAALKRKEALAEKETTETMKRQAHSAAMQRGTNEQTHGMTLEQQNEKNEQARGRLELADELDQETYEDRTDENGNIIGQRETGSNKYTPYATKGGSDLSDRQKLAIESLNDEIKTIYEGAEAMGGALTPEAEDRINRLTLQRNQMLYGGGSQTPLSSLLSGEGGGQGEGGAQGEPEAKPDGIRGLLGQRMQSNQQEEQTSTIQQEVDGLLDQTDDMLNRLRPKAVPGNMGRPSPNAYQEPSAEDIQAGEELVQRLIQLDENPEYHSAISQRQRANIVQRLMELKEAGVPINLDPKT